MATSPDAFNNPEEMAANVQQAFQGWAPGGQRPYARGLMGIGEIKSQALYDDSINRIRDVVARFNRYQFAEPGDVDVPDEDGVDI